MSLFVTQVIVKAKWALPWHKYVAFSIFTVISIVLTFVVAKRTEAAIKLKRHFRYKGDPHDITFKNMGEVLSTAAVCCFASMLCGCTGIAGGMVLGPLFMSYGMLPSVMSATNQYITMIASLSVVIQFIMLQELNWYFSALFGASTVFAAFLGLKILDCYMRKAGGKQSTIAVLLVICLTLALVSVPLNMMLKSNQKSTTAAELTPATK